MVLRMVSL